MMRKRVCVSVQINIMNVLLLFVFFPRALINVKKCRHQSFIYFHALVHAHRLSWLTFSVKDFSNSNFCLFRSTFITFSSENKIITSKMETKQDCARKYVIVRSMWMCLHGGVCKWVRCNVLNKMCRHYPEKMDFCMHECIRNENKLCIL